MLHRKRPGATLAKYTLLVLIHCNPPPPLGAHRQTAMCMSLGRQLAVSDATPNCGELSLESRVPFKLTPIRLPLTGYFCV